MSHYGGGYRGDRGGDRGDQRNNYRPEPEQGYGYPPMRDEVWPSGGGGGRMDRGRDRYDDRDRGRDSGRRERSRDRGDRERARRSRSRSRSGSPPAKQGRRRPTLFDVLPAGMAPGAPPPPAVLPGAQPNLAAAAAFAAPPPSLAGLAPPPMSGGGFGSAPGGGFGSAPGGPPAVSQQATRHARRIYVGGLPPTATEQNISSFFSHALAAIGGNTAGPGNAVVNVYINREKNFAFVELRTVEETSNSMALDGIMFEGVSVRVRRPNDYNPAAAASLGPSTPNPALNLAAIGLSNTNLGGGGGGGGGGGKANPNDNPDRIFVGGLPYYLTEEQCRELLGSFGAIKSFDLVKDRDTGNSKGYGFVVYQDPSVTDIACAGLNGLKMGDRTLTVRRATEGAPGGGGAAAPALGPAGLGGLVGLGGLNPLAAAVGGVVVNPLGLASATRIVVLTDAVSAEEIVDDQEYQDILEDMKDEASRHGLCNNVLIPRPTADNPTPAGMCKVIMEFNDVNGAVKARNAMHGRKFAGRVVNATYLTEAAYFGGRYDELAA
ncbi:hypothetical protein HYH02_010632 [Chlamydomonas schloesseri]|uniref:Splicing factor U2af large subunit n=1 Tax=Chlamydomonas schloesseri TaxID=2026947 RepID=A0A835TJ53_9CHLO|nr:hypothetical protein HYH02_010632 [Chlamydomonas schloesseri]|eukprot:KAG2439755.1 hypothetical protein HYH02_010632 [Chlamydomonas schloesseri]